MLGGAGEAHAHVFGSLKRPLKNALQRNSVWFSVHYIRKIVPALELAHDLFSYADIAWNQPLRDLFLRESPGSRWHQPWDLGKQPWKKRKKKKTNFCDFPEQLNFISMVLLSFLKWPLKDNNVLSVAGYFVLIKTFLKKTKWNIQTYQLDCVCAVEQLIQNTWERAGVWVCSFFSEFLPPE